MELVQLENVERVVEFVEESVRELSESQLAIIGGGTGEIVFG